MGRRYVYFCDACSKEFGDQGHINVKCPGLFWSKRKVTGRWGQDRIKGINCQEYHYCNKDCLIDFIVKKIPGKG